MFSLCVETKNVEGMSFSLAHGRCVPARLLRRCLYGRVTGQRKACSHQSDRVHGAGATALLRVS